MYDNAKNQWVNPQTFSTEWGGRTLSIKTGALAQQASGSALVQYGDTVVLVTATMGGEPRGDVDWFPLMVDYEERLYAAGIIKGSRFIKRETRPTDEAVLTARLVDRAIRPLFDETMRRDIQVIVTVLSVDGENDADIPAMIGAAAALMMSNIPWQGPVVGTRVGQIDGKWVLNPTYTETAESSLDLFVAGNGETTIMLEAGAKEVSEELVYDAIEYGLSQMGPIVKLLAEVEKTLGREKVTKTVDLTDDEKAAKEEQAANRAIAQKIIHQEVSAFFEPGKNVSKLMRKQSLKDLKKKVDDQLKEQQIGKDKRKDSLKPFKEYVEERITELILETETRVDGRALTEIRPLDIMVGALPRTHGTGVFTRGETQVMTIATLAGPGAEQILEGIDENGTKRYMHHYNFPGYSVGEVKPLRGPSRRDIGHGMLAEKALRPVIPAKADFPYTIRLVSEVLGSNGSSSMASVCGSSLALMHAGVPISAPVAGIAMGLVSTEKGDWKVLTDLQDLEDGKGGMDFKVAGSENGITAIQLDTKTKGIKGEILKQTLADALTARLDILSQMKAVIDGPGEMSPYAPRVETLSINPDKIRDLIGPGGKMINKIIDETGAEIDIEQDGSVFVSAVSGDSMAAAKKMIDNITKEVEAGEIYEGEVVRLMDFGAFVEILPGQDGLVHVSEISHERTENVADALSVGDKVKVKVKEIDDLGRINLSIKALIEPSKGGSKDSPASRPRA